MYVLVSLSALVFVLVLEPVLVLVPLLVLPLVLALVLVLVLAVAAVGMLVCGSIGVGGTDTGVMSMSVLVGAVVIFPHRCA